MLRVELRNATNTLTLRMEGRLVGTFAEEVRKLVARSNIPRKLVVDVSEVTFVDTVGEQVLAWLGRIGAEFVAESSYPRHVCEGLNLPLP
jgi:anti-anti-sigma regulatory factor